MSARPPVRPDTQSAVQPDSELSAQEVPEETAGDQPTAHRGQDDPVTVSAHETLRREALAAAERFERFRAPQVPESGETLSPGNIEAHLRIETHRIEKGMSIAAPRRPYGQLAQERIGNLLELAASLPAKHASLISAEEQAREALQALEQWNDRPVQQGPEHRDLVIARPYLPVGQQTPCHTSLADESSPLADVGDAQTPLDEFFLQRSSVRSFDPDRPVSPEAMERAVHIALNAPSVCNRATGRVHIYRGTEKIAPLLALQQGNRGLTGIRQLAIATVELSMFAGTNEFAQPWTDGGLFLMNLVWGFQVQGIGSCLLNWSMPEEATRELRVVADIPESELVISMVAFGYPQEGTFLTRSAKPPMPQVMTLH